jgi:membrane protein
VPGFSALGRLKSGATRRWQALKQARPGVAHVVEAYRHYKDNHGDHLAAAITYFSFLALFPLVLLGVSVTGFVLASQPHLQIELFDRVSTNLPGGFGDTVRQVIEGAIKQRTGVGALGLAGVALTGLGWIGNLRAAIDTVWGIPAPARSFLAGKTADALVLLGLGLGVVLSVSLTAGGTAASGLVLRALDLDGVTGAGTASWLLGILLGIAGSMLIFGWLMIRLPDITVPRRTALRAILLAAVGFEVLKLVGTFYIARITKSPAAAVIGPVVGVLVWIDLVSRYLLFCVAWAATAMAGGEPAAAGPVSEAAPAVPGPGSPGPVGQGSGPPSAPAVSPTAVAAGLLSAGAALGAGSLAVLQRWRHRATDRRRSAR